MYYNLNGGVVMENEFVRVFSLVVLSLFLSGIVAGFSEEYSYTCDVASGPNAGVSGDFTFMNNYTKAMLPNKENPSDCKVYGNISVCLSKEHVSKRYL